jgi:hypothetical protein
METTGPGDQSKGQRVIRVVVNLTRCQAYAQCAFLAPDVFRMRGESG